MGRWVFQNDIDETVEWFVRTALPDAEPGWEDLPWSVDEMGKTENYCRWWTIALDIPTSAEGMDYWLSFRVVEPRVGVQDALVRDSHAVKSGCGGHQDDIYVWDNSVGMWVTESECDENDSSVTQNEAFWRAGADSLIEFTSRFWRQNLRPEKPDLQGRSTG